MTTVTAKRIPPNSYEIRVFADDSRPDASDIETVLVLRNLGDGLCEASLAHGNLTNDTNALIALKAIELGFDVLRFNALKGYRVTRWAEYLRSDGVFDYYQVDLQAALKRFKQQGTNE